MDDTDHRAEAARIEHLLDELRSLAAGPVWERIEELVRRLVQLYGVGLARWSEHLRAAGVLEGVADRCAGDEVLASLLLVHGLHPWPIARRVEEALARARPQLRAHVGDVVLLGVEADVARVRLENGLPEPAVDPERLIQRAIADAAPEVARVELEGAPAPRVAEPLVQIGLPRGRPPTEAPR